MSKWPPSRRSKSTKKDKDELQKLTDEMMSLSVGVVEDYNNNPSEISGSVIRIHENSDFLSGSVDDS
tara:strand:+ start:507 stop:707 length:201 start_codon:yes stop_codon:yes gene_type:complete